MRFTLVIFSVALFATAFADPLVGDLLNTVTGTLTNTVDGVNDAVKQTSQLDDIINIVKVLPVVGDLAEGALDSTTNVVDGIVELVMELLVGTDAIDPTNPSVNELIAELRGTISQFVGGLPVVGALAGWALDVVDGIVELVMELLVGIGAIDPNDPSVNELIAELKKIINNLVKGLPVVGDLAGGVLDTVTDITEGVVGPLVDLIKGLQGETGGTGQPGETNPNRTSVAN